MPLIVPSADRIRKLRAIHEHLMGYRESGSMEELAKATTLMLQQPDFLLAITRNDLFKSGFTAENLPHLPWAYLYHHLALRDYVSAALILWGPDTFTPEPHFAQLIFDALFRESKINVMGCASAGKCLGPDVPVMLADGQIRTAKEIRVGDRLMGDDGKPRNVEIVTPGRGPMYRIIPERGEPWTCNDVHILTLVCNNTRNCGGSGKPSRYRTKGLTYDVPLNEYLQWSPSKKRAYSLYHVGVEFEEKPVEFDPYIYGAWLGDGGFDTPMLHKPEGPLSREWVRYFESLPDFRVSVSYLDSPCPAWCARKRDPKGRNRFTAFIRTSRDTAGKEKVIRDEYLRNSRTNRMKLLAGLIDSDGFAQKSSYEITSKSEALARQISWLARSLGFASTVKPCVKGIKSIGFSATYWRVYISGHGITEIPTRQKRVVESDSVKEMTWTGFKVEPLGEGAYNGFVIDGNHRFLLGDFTVTHNTYNASTWCLLDWLLDPEWTRIEVASNSEDHVKKNLYGDIVRLHSSASIPLPGKVDTMSISLDKKTGQGIFLLIIPGGPKPRGKAKGAKCKARPPHPLFGRWSRIRFIFDEAQEITPNIFDEIPNIFASIGQQADGGEDVEHIKVFMAANPKDEWSRYGKNCRPPGGWDNHDDALETWRSETGWFVIRLNAMKSENVLARREVYPRLISWHGVQKIIEDAGSDQDPIVYVQVYAKFPPQGLQTTIVKPEWLRRAQREWIFVGQTRALLGGDPAFTGDSPAVAAGRVGRAIAYLTYDGVRVDLDEPRWAIQVDVTGSLPRGDTQDLVDGYLERAKELRVEPEGFGIDRTGSGQGVYDIARRQWKEKVGPLPDGDALADVLGVHYSENASEVKVADEDTKTPLELYDRVASELWYAFAKLMEFDCIGLGKGVELQTFAELGARRGGMKVGKRKKLSVEGKDAYKARTALASPDRADAVTLLAHAGRMTTPNLIPKAKDTKADEGQVQRDPFGDMEVTVSDGMTFREYDDHVAIDNQRD